MLALHSHHIQGSEAVRIHHPQSSGRSTKGRADSYGATVSGQRWQQQPAVPAEITEAGQFSWKGGLARLFRFTES